MQPPIVWPFLPQFAPPFMPTKVEPLTLASSPRSNEVFFFAQGQREQFCPYVLSFSFGGSKRIDFALLRRAWRKFPVGWVPKNIWLPYFFSVLNFSCYYDYLGKRRMWKESWGGPNRKNVSPHDPAFWTPRKLLGFSINSILPFPSLILFLPAAAGLRMMYFLFLLPFRC